MSSDPFSFEVIFIFIILTVSRSKQTVKAILIKGRIVVAHVGFNRIRQVVQFASTSHNCMLLWTQPIPRRERHLDRFSRFYTVSLYFAMGRFFSPQN